MGLVGYHMYGKASQFLCQSFTSRIYILQFLKQKGNLVWKSTCFIVVIFTLNDYPKSIILPNLPIYRLIKHVCTSDGFFMLIEHYLLMALNILNYSLHAYNFANILLQYTDDLLNNSLPNCHRK